MYLCTLTCILLQVFIESPPIYVNSIAFEWHGERIYMAGKNKMSDVYQIWRASIVYPKGIELVYEISREVEFLSQLTVDSHRKG